MPRPAAIDMLGPGIEAELRRTVGAQRSPLYAMLRYHLGWTDQTGMPERHAAPERPLGTLCLLAAQAAGGAAAQAMPAAAAIELARAFALIHLEVSDGRPGGAAAGSRERSPVWWVWGHSQGINAGDAMYALARLAVMDLGSRGLPPETVVRATAALDHACLELCERRYAAIEDEASDGRTPDGYLRTVDGTAGALGACAAAMGALAAGARGPVVAALGQFGRAAGGAWHLRQELDGIWAEGGAGAGLVDALDRRRTLPLVFALSAATGERRARLEAAARRETMLTDEELGRLAGLVEELGARRFTEAAIAQRLGLAMDALELARVPDEAAAPLRGLARYLAGAAEGRRPS